MLPELMRPRAAVRTAARGLDLPSWFFDDLSAIDSHIYVIHHRYRVMWDDIMNQWEGRREDPRFCIHWEHGTMNWGWVMTDGDGAPIPENSWHLWRMCWPHGWAHVMKLECLDEQYLHFLLRRLHLQARFTDQYGHKAWNRRMDEEAKEIQERKQEAASDLNQAVQEENAWLLRRAMDNFDRGITAPTNPEKEQIISYSGQSHRSRVKRPITDEEGGLIVPADWRS